LNNWLNYLVNEWMKEWFVYWLIDWLIVELFRLLDDKCAEFSSCVDHVDNGGSRNKLDLTEEKQYFMIRSFYRQINDNVGFEWVLTISNHDINVKLCNFGWTLNDRAVGRLVVADGGIRNSCSTQCLFHCQCLPKDLQPCSLGKWFIISERRLCV
jgi:hypothetical protein